ncbi:hypothetical protein [Rhizobium sp. 9140]|uniref:hypothetical protein n=1 Tax=Rhizobium sp. 9140 TaxID=1761900 RepID=UPI000B32E8DE|nr:hypothetical protein [Rhizobium sp. 9140]
MLLRTPANPNTGFRLTLAAMAVMMAGASAPSPFYPTLQQEIGFTSMTLTAVFAVALFTLSYLAFGLPTLLAGLAIGTFGLASTGLVYGALIVLFSTVAGLLRLFGTRDRACRGSSVALAGADVVPTLAFAVPAA